MAKRIQSELIKLKKEFDLTEKQLSVNAQKAYEWSLLLKPNKEPYDNWCFKVRITFPTNYPFSAPKILFVTPMYHPNIDENGSICLNTTSSENWKPNNNIIQVVQELLQTIENPDSENCLRSDIGAEIRDNFQGFISKTKSFNEKNAYGRNVSIEDV